MKDNYGSLRRRTRDSSWQWLLMGLIIGVGASAVVCVGGYALGGIAVPLLEGDTATPAVIVGPNETEIAAMAMMAAQQTMTAASTPAPTGEQLATPSDTRSAPPDTAAAMPTSTATLLPNVTANVSATVQPTTATGSGPVQPTSTAAATTQTSGAQTTSLNQNTPVVGTPVDQTPQALSMPGGPVIPPELDGIKTEMVPITGGIFTMGTLAEEALRAMDQCALYGKTCDDPNWVSDSTTPHQVTIDSFQIETYEVTTTQYVAFLNWLGPNSHKNRCQGLPCALTTTEEPNSTITFDGTTYAVNNPDFYGNHPVVYVTWQGAVEYCAAFNRRLPTEAEWERAARGRENYIYPWGDQFDAARAMSSIDASKGTVAITSYPNGASPYGVFNMAGNVSEWVHDWYQSDYYQQQLVNPQPNPNGPLAGTTKVHRGGSWDTIPLFLRSVHRMEQNPGIPTAAIGFRCAADGVPAQPTAPAGSSEVTPGGAPTIPPQPTAAVQPSVTPTLSPF